MFRGFLFRNFVICSEKQTMCKQTMGKIILKRILKTLLYVYKEIKYT